jgi:hypothetical protein
MIQRCCLKQVAEDYMGGAKTWEAATGTLSCDAAVKHVNKYTVGPCTC